MTKIRRKAGGPHRARTKWKRPILALLGLALVGLAQTGCRSDGCSTCGGFGSRLSNGIQSLSSRVTRHFDGCSGGDSCGCGSEGTVIDSGVPVVPGGMVVPGGGTIVTPPPAIETAPTQLEAIPSTPSNGASNANPASNRSAPGSTNRSGYTTQVPKGTTAMRSGSGVTQALLSTSNGPARAADSRSSDVFDNLPPVDLPSDVTRKASTAAPATAAAPAAAPAPTTPAPAPAAGNAAPTPAEKVSAVDGAALSLPPINASAPQAPGIRRYASMAPAVSGGSAPSIEGLEWLKEKGCRTFVDLRRPAEIDPNFVDAVNDRNMVYISLPIVANRLEPSRLARFDDLISQSGNRPLYFCDSDGTRAGLAWFIHLRVVDQEDSQSALSKAEEIGLTSAEFKIAEEYLATHKPKPRPSTAKVAMATPEPSPEPRSEGHSIPTEAPPPVPPPAPPASALPTAAAPTAEAKPAAPPAPDNDPTPSMLPGEHRPQASASPGPADNPFRPSPSWKPVAALILTGVGIPIAFWTRSAFSESRSVRRRASLPGSAPRSLDAPPASDA